MVNACADPDFLSERGGGGWGGVGVQAQRRENSLDFFYVLFWGFLVQNFPGMRGGVQLFTRGGGESNANFYGI